MGSPAQTTTLPPITLTNNTPVGVPLGPGVSVEAIPALSIANAANATLTVLFGPLLVGTVGPNSTQWFTNLDQQPTFSNWIVITPVYNGAPVGTTCTITTYQAQSTVPPITVGNTGILAPRPGRGLVYPPINALLPQALNIRDFGAQGNGTLDPNCSITGGTAALTSTSSPGPFLSSMVGTRIVVRGAGTTGTDFATTISAVTDATHATLAANAPTGVSAALVFILVVDDYPAFRAAVAGLSAGGTGTLYLPAGVYFMDYTIATTFATVAGSGVSVQIRGAGRGSTWIVPSGSAPAAVQQWLIVNASNTCAVEDLSVLAPPIASSTFSVKGIQHLGGAGELFVRRVQLWNWATCIEVDAATGTGVVNAAIEDVDVTTSPVLDFGGGAIFISNIGGFFRSLNCDVHDFGVVGSNQDHGYYIHQAVEYEISHPRFYNQRGNGFCIHNFNGSGTSPSAAVHNGTFDSTTARGIICNPTVRQQLFGCRFYSTIFPVLTQFDTDIQGCHFQGFLAGNYGITQVAATPASAVSIRGCRFVTAGAANNAIQLQIAGSLWQITDCEFTCNQASAVFLNGGNGAYAFRDCSFADDGIDHAIAGSTGVGTPTLTNVNANVTAQAMQAGSNDRRGQVNFNVQTATIAAGTRLFTVTFAKAYGVAPYVALGKNDNLVLGATFYASAVVVGSFDVFATLGLTVQSGYKAQYLVEG